MAPGHLDETRQRAREVGADLRARFEELEPLVRERWSELEPVLRERWSEVEPIVRERWSEVEPVVQERWNALEPVVRERLEELEPAARQAQIRMWRAVRAIAAGLGVLPTTLVRLLEALAGTADEVAERGAHVGEAAAKRRRSARGIRMRRRTMVLSVAGGAGVGFAVGWLLARRTGGDSLGEFDEVAMDADLTPYPGASPVE